MSDDYSQLRSQISMMGLNKPDAYNPYAAGPKVYGLGARTNPTSGPVDKTGYRERDRGIQARKNALLSRLQAAQTGAYMSTDYLKGDFNG